MNVCQCSSPEVAVVACPVKRGSVLRARGCGDTPVDILRVTGCLVGCFGFNGPLRQYFSLYRAISQREGERKEK